MRKRKRSSARIRMSMSMVRTVSRQVISSDRQRTSLACSVPSRPVSESPLDLSVSSLVSTTRDFVSPSYKGIPTYVLSLSLSFLPLDMILSVILGSGGDSSRSNLAPSLGALVNQSRSVQKSTRLWSDIESTNQERESYAFPARIFERILLETFE